MGKFRPSFVSTLARCRAALASPSESPSSIRNRQGFWLDVLLLSILVVAAGAASITGSAILGPAIVSESNADFYFHGDMNRVFAEYYKTKDAEQEHRP